MDIAMLLLQRLTVGIWLDHFDVIALGDVDGNIVCIVLGDDVSISDGYELGVVHGCSIGTVLGCHNRIIIGTLTKLTLIIWLGNLDGKLWHDSS